MSGKIYNKNLTFLQDQPFAESFLTGSSYKKRRGRVKKDSSLHLRTPRSYQSGAQSSVGIQSFGEVKQSFTSKSSQVRNKSEKMKKAETSLVKHFCLALEREVLPKNLKNFESFYTRESEKSLHSLEYSRALKKEFVVNSTPHLLVSVDIMRNTLLSTRSSRTTKKLERAKSSSQFKKILRECRKIRLLYGNLSKRQLSRGTSKMRLRSTSGKTSENLLIWLESRLDIVLERSGFFGTVKAARQSVLNGKILVNSKVVRSPGFVLAGGDLIKVIQERLPTESLNKHFSILRRGVVLSSEVLTCSMGHTLSTSTKARTRNVVSSSSFTSDSFAISKPEVLLDSLKSKRYEKKVEKSFDFGTYEVLRAPKSLVLGTLPYESFYIWLTKLDQKQKELGVSQNLRCEVLRGKILLQTDLQSKVFAEPNKVWLDQKVSTLQSWRFLGSPHLLFSLFYMHAHLQKVMPLLAQTLNEGVLVKTSEKEVGKYKSYKTRSTSNWNKTSACMPKYLNYFAKHLESSSWLAPSTRRCFESCLVGSYRGDSSFPTILSLSGYCAVNTLGKYSIKTKPRSNSTSKISKGGKCSEVPTTNYFPSALQSSSSTSAKPVSTSIDGSKTFLNLIRQFLSQSTSNKNNKYFGVKDSHQSLDLFEVSPKTLKSRAVSSPLISLSISTCSQPLSWRTSQVKPKVIRTFTSEDLEDFRERVRGIVTDIHEFFGEDHLGAVTEVYNNLFSTPWFTSFSQDEYFSNTLELGDAELELGDAEFRDQKSSQIILESLQSLRGSIVRTGEKDFGDLLRLLFSDLLLYSLLIKKESLRVHLELFKKQQLDSRCLAPSWPLSARITSGLKKSSQRAFDSQVNPNLGLRVGKTSNTASRSTSSSDFKEFGKSSTNSGSTSTTKSSFRKHFSSSNPSSRVFAVNPQRLSPQKAEHKKINLKEVFVLGEVLQARRIKPLHLEVSYQSLCFVYLYPPQRVCLPVMIDVDCLAKAL